MDSGFFAQCQVPVISVVFSLTFRCSNGECTTGFYSPPISLPCDYGCRVGTVCFTSDVHLAAMDNILQKLLGHGQLGCKN